MICSSKALLSSSGTKGTLRGLECIKWISEDYKPPWADTYDVVMDLLSEVIFTIDVCVLTCFGSKDIQDLSEASFFGIKGNFKLLMASMGNLEQPAKMAESITVWHSPGLFMSN